jgi:hypothetical protein
MELRELMEVLRHLARAASVNRLALAEIRIDEYLRPLLGAARETALERLRNAIRAEPNGRPIESEFWSWVEEYISTIEP